MASYLKSHSEAVKDVVIFVLQEFSHDTLVVEAGKQELKKQIDEAVNQALEKWHIQGSVKQVLFTSFALY